MGVILWELETFETPWGGARVWQVWPARTLRTLFCLWYLCTENC